MPINEKQAVLSLAFLDVRAPELGATGIMWLIPVEKAEGLKEEFLATFGAPTSLIAPGGLVEEVVQDMRDDPGLVIAEPGENEHFLVQMSDMPPSELVCKCGITFDGAEPLEDLKRHMEAENG